MKSLLWGAALSLSSIAYAQTSQWCQSSSQQCVSINVPDATASSGSGDIYLQITAPEDAGWVGFGMGSGMAGAQVFILYKNSDANNVTLSPRLASGEFQPSYSSDIQTTLLEGTGISGGKMTANFKCSNCLSWSGGTLSVTSTNSQWIWASGKGQDIASSDPAYMGLNQHANRGNFRLDLSKARGGSSSNPFLSSGTATSTATASSPTDTNSNYGDEDDDSGSSGGYTKRQMILIAHGVIMGVTFAILLPLGVFIIKIFNNVLPKPVVLHQIVQQLSFILMCAGLGIGVWASNLSRSHFKYAHQIIGVTVVGMVFIQIFLGILHHSNYKKYQRRTAVSYAHIWWGRSAIILGMVNGGLGLQLAPASMTWKIVYSVVVAVIVAVYIPLFIIKSIRKRKDAKNKEYGSPENGHHVHPKEAQSFLPPSEQAVEYQQHYQHQQPTHYLPGNERYS